MFIKSGFFRLLAVSSLIFALAVFALVLTQPRGRTCDGDAQDSGNYQELREMP